MRIHGFPLWTASLRFILVLSSLFLAVSPLQAFAEDGPFLVILGVAQDGGHPHTACMKACCASAAAHPERAHLVSCLALIDGAGDRRFVFDATPDFPEQLRILDEQFPLTRPREQRDLGLDGVFLTHAHIGHYTGLMHVGREVAGAHGVPVYAMPRMLEYLQTSGPWSQLVTLENIELRPLAADTRVDLGGGIGVTPVLVPHRDEYSETVGYVMEGPQNRVLFVPDIDKWEKWDRDLVEVLAQVDRAYVDGTFFAEGEIPGRAMSEIPHPFIQETLALVADLPPQERAKLRFIHLNHSNPAQDPESEAAGIIRSAGCSLAIQGERYDL